MHTTTNTFNAARICADGNTDASIFVRFFAEGASEEYPIEDSRDIDQIRTFIRAGGNVTICRADGTEIGASSDLELRDVISFLKLIPHVTFEQIRQLRREAMAAGDQGMVETCDLALVGDWTGQCKAAHVACAEAIHEANRRAATEQ